MGCCCSKKPVKPVPDSKTYVAVANFKARTPEDLNLCRGDQVIVIDNKKSGAWWLAEKVRSGKRGLIPSNFVAKWNSIEAEPWFFGKISRGKSEIKLKHPLNPVGAYIVRESTTQAGNFVLSVLGKTDPISHYMIYHPQRGFTICKKAYFKTLRELIEGYTPSGQGIPDKLTKPCVQLEPPFLPGPGHENDPWEVDKMSVQKKKILGSGQFGDVWGGVLNGTINVAIKTLKPGTMSNEEFLCEAKIMKTLQHPKLVQLYAVCSVEEPYYIITELMRRGSLLSVLKHFKKISLPTIIDMAEQISDGMAFLESKKYIHRDLAARNVLVDKNQIVKVADFGLARITTGEYYAKQGTKFPIKWTAPEAITHNKFSTKSDVWSFGVVLYELITSGDTPYKGLNNDDVVEKLDKGYRMPRPTDCTPEYYQIMMDCWIESPDKRPTFDALRSKLQSFNIADYLDAPE